jgi:HlyD family secretion protein
MRSTAEPLDRRPASGLSSLVRRPSIWIVLLLLGVAGVIAALRARGPTVTTTVASRMDLEQHVIASGRVWVATRVQLSVGTSGRVVAVRAVEGQRVRAGDLLVQLDDTEARAAVSQAKAAVSQAAGRVEQLRKVGAIVATETSRQAEANLRRAESEFKRVEGLAAAGVMTRVDLDEARRNVEIARAQKNAADAQQVAATPKGVDSRVAISALLQSQAQLAGATARLEQTRVVAPQNGIILSRAVEPGYTVQPGITVLELAADGETQLVIEPDERNLAWIRLGQQGLASADAYPAETFAAEVSYIAPAIDPRRGSIEVRLNAPEAPAFLKPDMTVSVDLTVASKKQALTVPSEAVRGTATQAPWVLAVEGGHVARRHVTLGIRGDGRTEIQSGLEEGAEVVLFADQTLVDGQRVRAVRGGG